MSRSFPMFNILICVTDGVFDIEPWVYFFAGIKDIVWVKYVFGLFKQIKDLFAEHFVQEWCPHDSIIMFTTDVTFVFDSSFVEFLGHFFNQ